MPLPLGDRSLHQLHGSVSPRVSTQIWHPDPLSRFCRAHGLYQQTDTGTHRPRDNSSDRLHLMLCLQNACSWFSTSLVSEVVLFRSYEIIFRSYEIIFRSYEILFRSYEILFRTNEIIFFSFNVPYGPPYRRVNVIETVLRRT